MIATIYILAFILAVLYITYPKDFPELISNPKMLLDMVGMETKRRWMILTIGTSLWISKKRMAFSLWQMRDIIAKERAKKQQQQNTHD
jgi:hypothetical protein